MPAIEAGQRGGPPVSNSVKDTARDRSGRGLPPKPERRALGKAAAAARARARRRRKILRTVGTGVGVVAVVAGLAVGCTYLSSSPSPSASAAAATAEPTPTIDPAFDPQLRTRPVVLGATDTLTKLVKTMIVTGPGPAVQSGQTITVNYVGAYYANGNVFDTSWDKSPAQFQIGVGQVIAGWDQGLVGVPVGSRVQLDIPSDLAYGADAAAQGKPAGSLRFVVDILAAK
jgi:peptidylprolyl isomerase